MKRSFGSLCFLFGLVCSLCGCSAVDKPAGQTCIYIVAAVVSLLLLTVYAVFFSNKNRWMLVLFCSISTVNIGYCWLSSSTTLASALNANRLAYLGSVFLPMSLFMIIATVSKCRIHRGTVWGLVGLSTVIFAVTATPGILPIYYRDVSLITVNGVSALHKEYGPLHVLYLFYLLGYFTAMIVTIVHFARKKQADSVMQPVFLAVAAFVNIGVWLIEQFVNVHFEMLSLSYIITEMFLLGLFLMIQESDKRLSSLQKQLSDASAAAAATFTDEELALFRNGIALLTSTEHSVFELYVSGHSSKQILETLGIKENTLKYHNRNIYSKLGVSSRKQMLALAAEVTA